MGNEKDNLMNHPFDNYLYMGMKFSRAVKAAGIEKIRDLQRVTLKDLLKIKEMTIPRLRRIVEFMDRHKILLKQNIE